MYLPRGVLPPEPHLNSRSIVWEEVSCLLCGGSHQQPLVESPDRQSGSGLRFAVVQCQDCGLCYTNPRPRAVCLERFYPSDYRPHRIAAASIKSPSAQATAIPLRGERRLLDFGCGGGAFLQRMRACGWDVTGVDASHATVERLRSELSLNAFAGTLPHDELPPESFDVVTMWQSLEHVPHPKRVLIEARRLLTPDGRLYVAVPNIDSFAYRTFGSAWFGLDLPRHLTHFTPWTLQLMLERSGFQVESVKMVKQSAWLRHSARLALAEPRKRLRHWLLQRKWASRLAAAYAAFTGQADCMLATASVRESM